MQIEDFILFVMIFLLYLYPQYFITSNKGIFMPLDERIEDWKSSNLANTDFALSEMEKDIKRIREKIDSLEFLLEEKELLLIDQTALEVAVLLGYLDYRAENTKNIDQFIKSKFQEVVKELKEKKY